MLLSEEQILKVLVEAYESGWRGCLELKEGVAQSLLDKLKAEQKGPIITATTTTTTTTTPNSFTSPYLNIIEYDTIRSDMAGLRIWGSNVSS